LSRPLVAGHAVQQGLQGELVGGGPRLHLGFLAGNVWTSVFFKR
jgi:hypothetical protein